MEKKTFDEKEVQTLLFAAQNDDKEAATKLVERFKPLVLSIVNKYSRKVSEREDVVQVGMVGLTKAIQKFDLSVDRKFISYAVPTIAGEIKRYFRDCTWDVHVPRRVKEFYMHVNRAINDLNEHLQRSPNVNEIAEHLQVKEDIVLETMELMNGYNTLSLEATVDSGAVGAPSTYYDYQGVVDSNYEKFENHLVLKQSLQYLSTQEREIVELLFFENWTQMEVAHKFGVSQMHISRMRRKILMKLKNMIHVHDGMYSAQYFSKKA
ncbi:SigB/SigF/SigG family RNA polymerase sigma factor [Kurthia huakuii]|uniref:SigB/SigF/SigG family RNA polymerase sigma factor n=1 Tax=Kurthia huakuii TaxID=1421019 RepID=UPI000497FB3E|nr:SigB/SigF/SigG family RNA polymerase sigma factor [Kurthia huakuii]MBM7700453.1 RNA polymerase sigma-B factor [Kurthia huakuii]